MTEMKNRPNWDDLKEGDEVEVLVRGTYSYAYKTNQAIYLTGENGLSSRIRLKNAELLSIKRPSPEWHSAKVIEWQGMFFTRSKLPTDISHPVWYSDCGVRWIVSDLDDGPEPKVVVDKDGKCVSS